MKGLTKNRAALLRLFYTNPGQAYYMQEIGRILGKKPGYFQRTLNKMVKEGILTSEYSGNARYFKVNKEYPLYRELKSIVFKTVGVVGRLKKIMTKFRGIKYCFVYGSHAKGKETSLSDIDLVVIGNVNEDTLIEKLDMLERQLQREVNYSLYTVAEFRRAIKRQDPFIQEIIKDRKIMIIGRENELQKIS